MKPLKYLVMGVMGFFLIFAADWAAADKTDSKDIQRAVIKIDSISCGGCISTISAGLSSLKGYSGLGTNLLRKLIAVDFKEPLTIEDISKKLSEIGYPGTVETVEPVLEKETFAYLDQKRTGFGSAKGGGCCSSGGYPENNDGNRESTKGSCCSLPGASGSEQKF